MHKEDSQFRSPPLGDQTFARLRRDVLAGTYRDGVNFNVDEPQVVYGLSNCPLREAPNRLAQEGPIRTDERCGFGVAPISQDVLADILRMRLLLDVPARRESIVRGDDAWGGVAVSAYHRLKKGESRLSDGSGGSRRELVRSFIRNFTRRCCLPAPNGSGLGTPACSIRPSGIATSPLQKDGVPQIQ